MKLAILTNNEKLFESINARAMIDGCACTRYADEIRLARAALRNEFDAILLDASTGLDAVRPALKRHKRLGEHQTPVLVIALRADSSDIEIAFELGADDVVTAPLDHRELLARVRCAARRVAPVEALLDVGRIELGAYRFENAECAAYVHGKPVALANREFALAWLLFSRPGEFVTRREIAAAVWTSSEDVVGRSLEQHVYKLRKKLGLNGDHGIALRTRYALGYRIELHASRKLAADMPNLARIDARPAAAAAARPVAHYPTHPTARPMGLPARREEELRSESMWRRRADDHLRDALPEIFPAARRDELLLRRRRDDVPLNVVVAQAEREALFGLSNESSQQLTLFRALP
ncbi:MAG: response regulator transcription factor [Burkholderiaceae bacterium]